jgi:hypothetical protein
MSAAKQIYRIVLTELLRHQPLQTSLDIDVVERGEFPNSFC